MYNPSYQGRQSTLSTLILSSLFKELFLQPKLDIFRGVWSGEYGLGDTKSVDTPVSFGFFLSSKKISKFTFSVVFFCSKKSVDRINPPNKKSTISTPNTKVKAFMWGLIGVNSLNLRLP